MMLFFHSGGATSATPRPQSEGSPSQRAGGPPAPAPTSGTLVQVDNYFPNLKEIVLFLDLPRALILCHCTNKTNPSDYSDIVRVKQNLFLRCVCCYSRSKLAFHGQIPMQGCRFLSKSGGGDEALKSAMIQWLKLSRRARSSSRQHF